MTQNFLLVFTFEVVIFYFIIYSLTKTNNWVNDRQRIVDELSVDLPEFIRNLKSELEIFNHKIKKQFTHEPLSAQELGFLAGTIFTEILTSRIPRFPFKNKFAVFSIFLKLWKYRHRLKATIMNKSYISNA